jgi:hypothetical protein
MSNRIRQRYCRKKARSFQFRRVETTRARDYVRNGANIHGGCQNEHDSTGSALIGTESNARLLDRAVSVQSHQK